jgi:hypothetical protein
LISGLESHINYAEWLVVVQSRGGARVPEHSRGHCDQRVAADARRYAAPESVQFLDGVLDAIARSVLKQRLA